MRGPAKYLFLAVWVLVVAVLIVASFLYRERSEAIVAQVEPQRVSVSFPKPVRILEIHVYPGQEVQKGDLLVEVERPDMVLDLDKKLNELTSLKTELAGLDTELSGKLRLLELETDMQLSRIENELRKLRGEAAISDDLFQELARLGDYSEVSASDSLILMEIQALETERAERQNLKRAEQQRLRRDYASGKALIRENIRLVELEIDQLEKEQTSLTQYATLDGTIGNVYVEQDEVIDAFENILSVYESNPSVIKAFMDESYERDFSVGQQVWVESSNRSYRVEGEIIEIGSRIVQYPNRLLSRQNQDQWGQEVFIQIDPENQFLNGERVFVLFE